MITWQPDGFAVCVGNYGGYAAGVLADRWVRLPMPPRELETVLDGIRRQAERTAGGPCGGFYVSDYEAPFRVPEASDIRHLNVLAHVMADEPGGMETVRGALDCGIDGPDSLLGLANWIEQADEVPYFGYSTPWGDSPEEKLGYSIASDSGIMEALEQMGVDGYFDFELYGEALSQELVPGPDGYIDATQRMPSIAYGWDELAEMHGCDGPGPGDGGPGDPLLHVHVPLAERAAQAREASSRMGGPTCAEHATGGREGR